MLAGKAKKLAEVSSSMEHYLADVLELRAEKGYVRVSDMADKLKVAKATVSNALKVLAERGLVRHALYGFVELSDAGELRARQVKNRYQVLHHFFIEVLGIEPDKAHLEACLAEHVIGTTTIDRLIDFIKFIEHDAPEAKGLLARFRGYHRACETSDPCDLCGTDRCEVLLGRAEFKGKSRSLAENGAARARAEKDEPSHRRAAAAGAGKSARKR